MGDIIARTLSVINDQLDSLQAAMSEGPADAATERYASWKRSTLEALGGMVGDSWITGLDQARGMEDHKPWRRPVPPVFLHGAASRAFLVAMKKDLLENPAAVLVVGPSEQIPTHPPGGILRVLDLLEHRLGKAFRLGPRTERDVQDGFEALLAGSGIAYQRGGRRGLPQAKGVPDFAFPRLAAALRLTLCASPHEEAKIAAEIDDVIHSYRTTYPRILVGVFDLGFIQSPEQFSAAYDAHEDVWVLVVKPPR